MVTGVAPSPPQITDTVAAVHGPNDAAAQYHDHEGRDDGDDVDQADDGEDVHKSEDGDDIHQAEDGEDVHQAEDGEDVKQTEDADGDDVTPESAESDSPPVASAVSSAEAPEQTAVHEARDHDTLRGKMFAYSHHPHQRRATKDQVTNANTPLNKNTNFTDHRYQSDDGSSKTDDHVVNANAPVAGLTEHKHEEKSADQSKPSTDRTAVLNTPKGDIPIIHQHSPRKMRDQVINANTPLSKATGLGFHRYQSDDGSSKTDDSVLGETTSLEGLTYHNHEEKNSDQSKPSTDHTVVLGTPKGDIPLIHQHADGTSSQDGHGNSSPTNTNNLIEGLTSKLPLLQGRTNPNHMNTETTGLNPGTHGETYKLSHREPTKDTVLGFTTPLKGTGAGVHKHKDGGSNDSVAGLGLDALGLDYHDHEEGN